MKSDKLRQSRKIIAARNFQLQCETAPRNTLNKLLPLTEESLKISWKNGFDAGFKAGLQAGLTEQDRAA